MIAKLIPMVYIWGRWFQNDLTRQYNEDRLSVCQENQDLMHPAPYITIICEDGHRCVLYLG